MNDVLAFEPSLLNFANQYAIITLEQSWMHGPTYVIMVVADVLAPNGRQAISNHHADPIKTKMLLEWFCITHISPWLIMARRRHMAT